MTLDSLARLRVSEALSTLERHLRRPNIFHVLRSANAELRHSNMLAWLLDPQGSHELGQQFLRSFLRESFDSRPLSGISGSDWNRMPLDRVYIRREWQNVDILIDTESFVIAIENKIWSDEHSNQLHRYYQLVKEASIGRKVGFIFLTRDAASPSASEDRDKWNAVGYDLIANLLQSTLEDAGVGLSDRARIYIEDYLGVLRRDIMTQGEEIQLAREIYQEHRQAIDFILRHRPDRMAEVSVIFNEVVSTEGWVLGSCSRAFTRFLTSNLLDVVPLTINTKTWQKGEAFLFEFAYWEAHITFLAAVPTGTASEQTIAGALRSIPNSREKPQPGYLVYFRKQYKVDLTDPVYTDELIRIKVRSIIAEVREDVARAESAIIGIRDQLSKLATDG